MTKTRILAIAATVGCTAIASSFEIWATDNLGPTNAGSNGDQILRFDSANPVGTVTVVGAAGIDGLGGLDFDGSGNLYAAGSFGGSLGNFYSISQVTGAATLLGASGQTFQDLSWNPMTGQMEGLTDTGGLYTVSTVNGAASLIGNITGLPAGVLLVGLSTDSAGNRFVHDIATDQMYALGVGTAATAMSATLGFNSNFSQGMVINHGGADEWIHGYLDAGTFTAGVNLVNSGTGGVQSNLGVWPTHTNGLPLYETGDLAINPVPEPGTFIAIGIGLAGLAIARRRK